MAQLTHTATLAPPLALAPPDDDDANVRRNRRALWVGVAVFAALSLWMGERSKGFLEADACTHYMDARHAMEEPAKLTSVWGRPLCTGSYFIPAALGGYRGVRLMSLAMAIVTGLVTYRIARAQGYRLPALGATLLFAQPLFYLHSFSALTEIPFALVAVLAFWAYQSRQFLAMAILVAITPTGRPEGFFLIALAGVALMAHGRWFYLMILPLPLMLWSYLGWVSHNRPPDLAWYLWLKKQWPYSADSPYGSGPWYHFIMLLPVLVSPFVFPALLPGVARSIRAGWRRAAGGIAARRSVFVAPFFTDHRARCQFLIAFVPLTIMVVHGYLWFFGKIASNGELRYLLCVAPLWALLCAAGWEWAWARFRLPAPFLWAALAASGPALANVYYRVVPLRLYDEDLMCAAAADWYRATPDLSAEFPFVMASATMIYFDLDRSTTNHAVSAYWGRPNVQKVPPGVILFWDEIYGTKNSDQGLVVPKADIEAAGWIPVRQFTVNDKACYVYLSTRTAAGGPTDVAKYKDKAR